MENIHRTFIFRISSLLFTTDSQNYQNYLTIYILKHQLLWATMSTLSFCHTSPLEYGANGEEAPHAMRVQGSILKGSGANAVFKAEGTNLTSWKIRARGVLKRISSSPDANAEGMEDSALSLLWGGTIILIRMRQTPKVHLAAGEVQTISSKDGWSQWSCFWDRSPFCYSLLVQNCN